MGQITERCAQVPISDKSHNELTIPTGMDALYDIWLSRGNDLRNVQESAGISESMIYSPFVIQKRLYAYILIVIVKFYKTNLPKTFITF